MNVLSSTESVAESFTTSSTKGVFQYSRVYRQFSKSFSGKKNSFQYPVQVIIQYDRSGDYYVVVSGFYDYDETEFLQRVEQWHSERGLTSSISKMVSCSAYRKIIGMGQKVVPMIIAQLKREGNDPDHWFAALETITGQNPVPEDDYGNTTKMATAWISWAKEKNVF